MNRKQTILVITAVAVFVLAALYFGLNPGSLAGVALGLGVSTWSKQRRRKREIAFWSIVWQLRQADTAGRATQLADLNPPRLRRRVAAILEQDGSNEASGDVEQFPFPRGLRRSAVRAYWAAWFVAFAMLLFAAFVPAPVWVRSLPIIFAAVASYGAWAASRRERSYDSVVEVTPFRVSELFPDGGSRTILFNRYLELHHEPKLRRLRLTPSANELGIPLDFRRMGFDRMVDLILTYGEFRDSDSAEASNDERGESGATR